MKLPCSYHLLHVIHQVGITISYQPITCDWLGVYQWANLDACMESFKLVIVASVRPPENPEEQLACQVRLDRLEGDRVRCLDEHGGMNVQLNPACIS
jgi:hypothetical protein